MKGKKRRKSRRMERFMDTVRRVFKTPSAKLGGVVLGLILVFVIFAPVFAPYAPDQMDLKAIYSFPSKKHWFGTDSLGRDLFSRILYGGRYSLALGICAAALGNIMGVVVGSIAGYFGGRVDNLIMRFCDIWSALPGLLLTILVAVTLGHLNHEFLTTVIALSIGGLPQGARMIRGQILSERGKEYLEAAEAYNCSKASIMFRHLLPNVISPTLVGATMAIGGTIMQAAGLSYLGLGVKPPTPEWGAMLSEGTSVIRNYPYMILFPGLAIGITVLAINLLGDGVRDALDPKLRD